MRHPLLWGNSCIFRDYFFPATSHQEDTTKVEEPIAFNQSLSSPHVHVANTNNTATYASEIKTDQKETVPPFPMLLRFLLSEKKETRFHQVEIINRRDLAFLPPLIFVRGFPIPFAVATGSGLKKPQQSKSQ